MDFDALNNNQAIISGKVISEPEFSHEIYGEHFYEFFVEVKRLSDSSDTIPVTISENLLDNEKIKTGKYLSLLGQFRSYNKLDNNKSRLLLTMFVREVLPYEQDSNPNEVEIVGYLCKEPIYRTTPFKREICDILVAVNRSYNKSDYLPCIAWGRNARYAKNLKIGDKIQVIARIQSRNYQKRIDDYNVENRTAYELSVSQIRSFVDELEMNTINTPIGPVENYYA